MRVLVNGEPRGARDGETVASLLAALGLDARKLAVERNRAIVPKSAYGDTVLSNDDVIEIVHFVGGG
jgi:thiamine biosynthesis protein ThiS